MFGIKGSSVYKFVHDAASRIVYRYPAAPDVQEKTDKRGRRTDWYVTMDVLITRADNKLIGNRWQHATSDYPRQYLGAQYTREQAVTYFMMHHAPRGDEISETEYEKLHAEYEAEALSR